MCDDLSRLVKRYDKDVNGTWSFREFLTFVQPLTQYSLKAKDLSTGLELNTGGPKKVSSGQMDKQLLDETSSTSSLGELNALLRKKTGKENRGGTDRFTPNGYSRASKSTAAMSYVGASQPGQYSTIAGGGHHTSVGNSESEEMFGMT